MHEGHRDGCWFLTFFSTSVSVSGLDGARVEQLGSLPGGTPTETGTPDAGSSCSRRTTRWECGGCRRLFTASVSGVGGPRVVSHVQTAARQAASMAPAMRASPLVQACCMRHEGHAEHPATSSDCIFLDSAKDRIFELRCGCGALPPRITAVAKKVDETRSSGSSGKWSSRCRSCQHRAASRHEDVCCSF